MAEVKQTPPKRSKKGAPPSPNHAPNNLQRPEATPEAGQVATMNFRVDEEFKREFKTYAVQEGMTMSDLLQRAFREYRRLREGER